MMNFVLKTMNFELQMMNFILKMMNLVLKMMNLQLVWQGDLRAHAGCGKAQLPGSAMRECCPEVPPRGTSNDEICI